jgi:bifunctional UDP-N-acetylglucosamine pyrophosphorylase/glucosamine-1-phosphate N-acetyltransferase
VSPRRPVAVVVLAAGEGTRMRSALPKVLHPLAGRSLLGHALTTARAVDPEHLVVVVRHARDQMAAHVAEADPHALVADQDAVPGTGRAVRCGLAALPDDALAAGGTVLVTYGDVPLLAPETLQALAAAHDGAEGGRRAVTVLTAQLADPTGYGRVVRDEGGAVAAIVEHRDATEAQRALTEVNSGIYAFDAAVLAGALPRLGSANDQGEVYLTDVLALARAEGGAVAALPVADAWQTEGVNDRVQLARLHAEANRRIVQRHQLAGATVVDPATTWVDADVRVGRDVTLLPGTALHGATVVEDGATVGPDTTLTDVRVGPGASVVRTHGSGAVIGAGASVGPFSYLRPGTALGEGGRIGAFVETKGARIGRGSKVPHLSYVGDADIGDGVNIGAATVFVNYDGVAKHRTTVGDHARIGSDTMLVAPLVVGDGAYTAAGSVITADVPPGAMAVARGVQRNVRGWVERRRPGSPAADAARRAREAEPPDQPETPTTTDAEGGRR